MTWPIAHPFQQSRLSAGGGPARFLAVASRSQVLYAATDSDRLVAFDHSQLPMRCIAEGPGGGPLASLPEYLAILAPGGLQLRRHM
eukprot:s3085_g6.t1